MRRKQTAASRSHEAATIESLAKDPAYAAEYLNAVLADGEVGELLVALRRVARGFGGVTALAARAGVNPTSLYRALSAQGNPEVRSLAALLKAMGMKLAVQPIHPPRRRRAAAKGAALM